MKLYFDSKDGGFHYQNSKTIQNPERKYIK